MVPDCRFVLFEWRRPWLKDASLVLLSAQAGAQLIAAATTGVVVTTVAIEPSTVAFRETTKLLLTCLFCRFCGFLASRLAVDYAAKAFVLFIALNSLVADFFTNSFASCAAWSE